VKNTRKIQTWSHVTCSYYTMSYNALRNDNEMRIVRITLFLDAYVILDTFCFFLHLTAF